MVMTFKTNNPLSNNRVTSRREKIIHKTEQKLNFILKLLLYFTLKQILLLGNQNDLFYVNLPHLPNIVFLISDLKNSEISRFHYQPEITVIF